MMKNTIVRYTYLSNKKIATKCVIFLFFLGNGQVEGKLAIPSEISIFYFEKAILKSFECKNSVTQLSLMKVEQAR